MNSKYVFYPNGKRVVLDLDKMSLKSYKDVDVSMMEPAIIPMTEHIATDGVEVKYAIENLLPYLDQPDARIRISSGDSYNDGDLEVFYSRKETVTEFERRKTITQKEIFGRWKDYNDKKDEAEKNKEKTIDKLRKQAKQLGFDLTKKV